MTDTPKEPNVQSEREAFEAWHLSRWPETPALRKGAGYHFHNDQLRWEAWLAALESRTPIPAQAGEREALPIDYSELIAVAARAGYPQGSRGCIAFKLGAEWQARAALASRAAAPVPSQPKDNQ